MKLFAIVTLTNRPVKDNGRIMFFSKKQDAKAARDKLNGGKFGSKESSDIHRVTYGPDHIQFRGTYHG